MLLGIATPIAALIVVYFAYALIVFRHRDGGAARRGSRFGATAGSRSRGSSSPRRSSSSPPATARRLLAGTGSGGGQGPNPIAKPGGGPRCQVQVIGQQWNWTYRYPSFGGVETPQLELPVDQDMELHVTSLDVIHSFWARQLGVKADANPGVDNVAYVRPTKIASFDIRCAELCGLFHGHMFQTGQVVSDGRVPGLDQTASSACSRRRRKKLNPYNPSYLPKPERRAG